MMMASGEVSILPVHTSSDGLQRHKSKTKRTKSSNPLRTSDPPRGDHTSKTSSTSSGTGSVALHGSRPSLNSRTNSAPHLPLSKAQSATESNNNLSQSSCRDSVTSIKDDPFFRNYQTPQSVSLARELRSATHSSHGRDDSSVDNLSGWINKRSAAGAQAAANSRSGMDNINIAVIGAAGVGKSTLIQRALGLRSLPTAVASSQKMSVDSVVYTVSLVELDLETFDFNPDRRVQWPKQINGQIVPRMDGALILYDVMNRESLTDLPQTLNALVYSAFPTILVSCKCDNPVNTRQIDAESIEAACLAEVETVKTAANVPESARLCLGAMLRAVMANRLANAPVTALPRRRAASSTNLEAPSDVQDRPISQESKHSRASSEYSMLRGFPSPPPTAPKGSSALSSPVLPRQSSSSRKNGQYQYSVPAAHTAPPLSSHPAFRAEILPENSDSETDSAVPLNSQSPIKADLNRGANSFLDMEESDADSAYRYSDDLPILQRSDDSFNDKPPKVTGFTFDELVDRLLDQHMSKADSNFSDIFLCLYRKFAAPGELFSAILARLEQVAKDSSVHYLTRTGTQLRIITIVAKWVSNYPGDFASPQTRERLGSFIDQLSAEPEFAAAAQEMRTELQFHVIEDDDTGWARTDADVDSIPNLSDNFLTISSVRSTLKPSNEFAKNTTNSPMIEENVEKQNHRPSEAASISSGEGQSISESSPPLFQTVEDYEIEARKLVPSSTLPLTKFRYHICMDTSDDDFADEITRIDWVMFSSIRVRDLVRHVSLPLEQKEKCKSLANVNRMIDHFNHVAKWVSNMILMRDKAKHRAQMLEKFMRIALKLRQLNNYNGLAAVIAGINGSAVHRLAQTRVLVPAECQKRFMRLELLMSTQKSHFAYRLAWENSSLPRIPFIPLHRRDLVSAEEGSRTFIGPTGDRINWKKFEVLAEVILPIMRSQGTPYPNLERHEIAQELILDCRMPTDEEEIYQRSLQLESSSASTFDAGKKKFPWFQK